MTEQQYYVLKLRSGETIFAEIVGTNETIVKLANPWQVDTKSTSEGEAMSMVEWMPYVDQEVYAIPVSMCYYVGPLSPKFVRFYGSALLQSKISEIKRDVYDNMHGRQDYHMMAEGVSRMKEVAKEYKEKFDLEDDALDFSQFDEALENFKPVMH